MSPFVQLLIGVFMISAGISYAWWSKIRVYIIRRELAGVLEQLEMCSERNKLDRSPAEIWCEHQIAALMQFAPYYSWSAIFTVALSDHDEIFEGAPATPRLPQPIADAHAKAVGLFAKHLLYRTASGWTILAIVVALGKFNHLKYFMNIQINALSRTRSRANYNGIAWM